MASTIPRPREPLFSAACGKVLGNLAKDGLCDGEGQVVDVADIFIKCLGRYRHGTSNVGANAYTFWDDLYNFKLSIL